MKPAWRRASEYAGLEIDRRQSELLERYGTWLANEGHLAGGIGPAETDRIDRRHLADSLLFASQFPHRVGTIWDLGSGVGLPGIPLAIALPEMSFRLLDRSGRRVDLMRRALRVLGVENCQVSQGEIADVEGEADVLVSRASLPPDEMTKIVRRLLAADGVAVVAGSWREAPRHRDWETVEIPPYVLDQPIWLLIMRPE